MIVLKRSACTGYTNEVNSRTMFGIKLKNSHSLDTLHMKMSCATAFLVPSFQGRNMYIDKTCMLGTGAVPRNASHMSLLVFKTRILFRIPLESYTLYVIKVELMNLLAVSPAKIKNMFSWKKAPLSRPASSVWILSGQLRLPLRGRVDAGGT